MSPPRSILVSVESQMQLQYEERKGEPMKKPYSAPTVIEYGPIADHTFDTPGGVKGCQEGCHLDMFQENSGGS